MLKMRAFALIGLSLAVCSLPAMAGSLYVSDLTLNTVQVFNSTTGALTGSLTPTGGWGSPTGITVAGDGSVYVADSQNNVVDKFNAAGTFVSSLITTGLDDPSGLAIGPDGDLYVANFGNGGESYIAKYGINGAAVNLAYVPASDLMTDPGAIAFGPGGNLFIADSSNGTVDKVTSGGVFSTIVGAGCTGGTHGGASNPEGIAVGSNGNVFVSDTGSGACGNGSAVYEYDSNGNPVATFVSPTIPQSLSSPIDLVFGPDGNLYVTDATPRVAEFNGTTGAYIEDFISGGGSGGPLSDPTFLAFSPTAQSGAPEPATFGLMGLGLGLFGVLRGRRGRREV